jgi:hypothetical protein
MPRYTIILGCTTDARARARQYVWAKNLDAAKGAAIQRLQVMREVAHDGLRWNRWTVEITAAPRFEPITLASGGIDGE